MKTILKLYYSYKKKIAPVVLLSLSFFIIFRVIIPQLSSISESNQMISDKNKEISVLRETLNVISTLNQNDNSTNLLTSTKALPSAKDIAVIFSALSSAATSSQTDLAEFSLKVGGLYGRAAKSSAVRGAPTLEVIARVTSSDPKNFVEYAKELQTRLPLSEIKSIEANQTLANYELGFYYKPIDLSLVAKQDRVTPLSPSDLNLISQLEEWDR